MESVRATVGAALADRYTVERELGAGAMALVFLAHDLKHDRRVALKVLRPELASAIGSDRFYREIEVVAALTHPHILPLHDSGEAAGHLFYVMPYIEGESLRARLTREGRLPVPTAVRITREVADALGYAHRRGVIHRDVKPGNILLSEDHALLADFGIARVTEAETGPITRTGLALGTPTYLSPEQATAERDIDGRSDIYSLGCVLYEALTGHPPFEAATVRGLILQHVTKEPTPVRSVRPDVSTGVEAVVHTALQKEPEKRFQTAEEMAGLLDLVSSGFEPMRSLRKLIGRRRRWLHGWRLAVLATAAVTLLVIAGLVIQNGPRPATVDTYILVPVTGGGATEREEALAEQAVRSLYYQLAHWRSIEVVPPFALEGGKVELQLAGLSLPSFEATRELAARYGASHVVEVDARADGDSLALVATIRRRGDRRARQPPFRRDGRVAQLELITAGLALDLLNVRGESVEYEDLVRQSPVHTAQQALNQGRDALYDWRLAEAETRFRDAIEADSAFALAHHYLAQTLYWRTVRDANRSDGLGPEIEYHTRRALQHAREQEGRLRPGALSHAQAFHAFWTGDFEGARVGYDSILDRNPSDMEALILRGSVEQEDFWLATQADGTLSPRMDLDVARAMYDSAAGLNNQWLLAWGRLYDLDRKLANIVYTDRRDRRDRLACDGFYPPDVDEQLTPYSRRDVSLVEFFCPLALDGSTVWMPLDSVDADHREGALEGVRRAHANTVRRLEKWTSVNKGHPRQLEELADWALWERSIPGCAADPFAADSLAALALSYLERSLEIRRDTTPEDRVRLATVRMADGDFERARADVDRALEELGDWRSMDGPKPPYNSANPYLALGLVQPTLEILESIYHDDSRFTQDPEIPEQEIPMGSSSGALRAIAALGYMGYKGRELEAQFARLERIWPDTEYSERQQVVLRWESLSLVGPAIVRAPELWSEWLDAPEAEGLELPAVWKALRMAENQPEEARRILNDVIRDLDPADRSARWVQAVDFYLPLALAVRTDSDSLAEALKRRALECPLMLHERDFGWGMKWNLTRGTGG